MTNFKIQVDLGGVLTQVPAIINEQVFPHLSQAVMAVADKTAENWKVEVMKAKLWHGEKQAYAGSITWRPTGPLSARVESDYKHALEIDNGRPSRDLKVMLKTSKKIRETKTGKKYLIIPFRHNTPGNTAHAQAMPQEIYDQVSSPSFQKSRITSKTTRLSASGHKVPQNVYAWGSKLSVPKLPNGRRSKYDGMYRFDTSSGKQKSSSYLTFRTMMEGSSGWIVPARPGLHIIQGTAQAMQAKAEKAFAKAMELDTSGGN